MSSSKHTQPLVVTGAGADRSGTRCLGASGMLCFSSVFVFFFNDTATTEIYTLSLHDALPICPFFVAAAPPLFILPISRCGSAPLFILPISRCGSALLFILPICCCGSAHSCYTYQFLLRQHRRFLYCPFLVAAAPRFLYCLVLFAADRKSVV